MTQKKFTKQEIIDEFKKCGKDPIYFLKTYAKITHPDRGLIPFETHSFQEDIIQAYLNNKKNIILKSRQIGVSTITGGFCAWLMLFRRQQNIIVIANKREVSTVMVKIVKTIVNNLPAWFSQLVRVTTKNVNSIGLSNGSIIKALANTANAGRSEAVSFLVVDEAAAIEKFEDLWAAVSPTTSQGGRIAVLSTPKGQGSFFHKMYEQAKSGDNGFNCTYGTYVNPENPNEVYNDRFMWWVYPTYTRAWFEAETRGKSPKLVAQEYCCDFAASGDTFLENDTLKRLEFEIKEPISKMCFDRNLWIFENPIAGGMYVISCDVSSGNADDFSAFHVLRMDGNFKQAAEYKGKVTPDILGDILVDAAKLYNNAVIATERNAGWAGQTIMKINLLGYPFLYFSPTNSAAGSGIIDIYRAQQENLQPGYVVSSINRVPMLAKLEEVLRLKHLEISSSRTVAELKHFIYNNGRPEAMKGFNDDLVMSLAGGCWVHDESYAFSYKNADMTKALLNGMSVSSRNVSNYNQFNHYQTTDNNGMKVIDYTGHNLKVPNGEKLDFSWLLGKMG